jgi:adenosylhomocysteine nucleosidase
VTHTAFVVGLAVEARVLSRTLGGHEPTLPHRIACAAADAERARAAAERLLSNGAAALISFGIAGGLDPRLMPGDLVLAETVRLPNGRAVATAAAWRGEWETRANTAGLRSVGGILAGSPRVVGPVADKRRLHETAGAVAVDMESHAVGQVAEAAGVPFLVIRAVADPAGRPLPSAVIGSIGPDGLPRPAYAAARLALRPWQMFAVLRLRQDTEAALSALGGLARLLGPDLLVPPRGV